MARISDSSSLPGGSDESEFFPYGIPPDCSMGVESHELRSTIRPSTPVAVWELETQPDRVLGSHRRNTMTRIGYIVHDKTIPARSAVAGFV